MFVTLHVLSLLISRNAMQLQVGYFFRNKDLGFWREIKCTFTNNLHVSQYLQLSALTETLEINTFQYFLLNVKFPEHHDMSSVVFNVRFFSIAVDFVSAPFCVSKSHIYEGIENPDTFFRPALRSLLVSVTVLILPYNQSR